MGRRIGHKPCSAGPIFAFAIPTAQAPGRRRAGAWQKARRWLPILLLCLLPVVVPVWAIDINQADAAQLQTLKGIGPRLAERILAERARGGFRDFQDLSSRVKGVGAARIRQWQAQGATVSLPGRPALTGGGQAKTPSAVPPAPVVRQRPGAPAVEVIEGGQRRRKRS
ncbi:MAG: DUF655 domain-containing protein [Lautropia sp.]|nr:DUF655 domain-containing protein [Lautropia sp.]